MIAGVLLAAGESRRFGRDKLLEHYRGEALVLRAAGSLLKGGLSPVIVVVPPGDGIREVLASADVIVLENREARLGIGHSIALGVGNVPGAAAAALIAVADQPLMDEGVVERLRAAFEPGSIVTPIYGSHAGNPRIFDRRFFPELRRLKGDSGGQSVAAAYPDAVIECAFPELAGIDIDRPEDWRKLPG